MYDTPLSLDDGGVIHRGGREELKQRREGIQEEDEEYEGWRGLHDFEMMRWTVMVLSGDEG